MNSWQPAVRRWALAVAALTLSAWLAPASLAARAARTAARHPKPAAAKNPTTAKPVEVPTGSSPVTRLTQLDSGPGLVVCDPTARGAGADTADFGIGCGRWLNLIVAGHGELGKTPRGSEVTRAHNEIHTADLRLTAQEAVRLAPKAGISHVAIGEIEGNAHHCTLTYRLWEVPAAKALGEPLTTTGTEDEVIAALPKLAAGLAALVGIHSPRIPTGVGETAAELRAVGQIYQPPGIAEDDPRMAAVHAVAMQMVNGGGSGRPYPPVLAAFTDLRYRALTGDAGQAASLARGLMKVLPENALIFGELAQETFYSQHVKLADLPVAELRQNLKRFPNNYLFNLADCYFLLADGQLPQARSSAERAVRCATANPDAWLALGDLLYTFADRVRHARTIDKMTPAELNYCQRLYDERLPIVRHVVQVDPQHGVAWQHVSAAAAFQGDGQLADAALWKALRLQPNRMDVYWWGLQLYQPKWYEDRAKLTTVARMAAGVANRWTPQQRVYIAVYTYVAGLPELAQTIVRADDERTALQDSIKLYEKQRAGEK
jgi:tetratricopeptide (TPR) repeat protein